MADDTWRPVVGFEGYYEGRRICLACGRIRQKRYDERLAS